MSKIPDYLKVLIVEKKMKDFVVINFGECFVSTREKFYSVLGEEKILE